MTWSIMYSFVVRIIIAVVIITVVIIIAIIIVTVVVIVIISTTIVTASIVAITTTERVIIGIVRIIAPRVPAIVIIDINGQDRSIPSPRVAISSTTPRAVWAVIIVKNIDV